LLLVTTDNDLITANPTRIYAFAVSADSFSPFQKQQIDTPLANARQTLITYTSPLPAYDIHTRATSVSVTFKNTGATAIPGPVNVAFPGLPQDVVPMNQSGTSGSQPYFTITSGDFAPGAESTVTLRFSNPANFGFELHPVYYSGSF
jgi:hypothetical protein